MFKHILLFLLLPALIFAPLPAAADLASQSVRADNGAAVSCTYRADIAALLGQTSQSDWAGWIARLSGAASVDVNGVNTRILTRYSYAMFTNPPTSLAYAYVLEKLGEWYPPAQIADESYLANGLTWHNLVLTLPGTTHADETVLLSAHLDSFSYYGLLRPGAEDNASGSGALLEAARIFRTAQFERTLRLIWFTGEEQGLYGSKAYVNSHALGDIRAVINLDMYGYDADNDGCFEVHTGTLPASAPIGACFAANVQAYSPALKVDLINTFNLRSSDHAPFWDNGIGALEVLENYHGGPSTDACAGLSDSNPWYHTPQDTLDKLNLDSGFAITRSALATAASLAVPNGTCFSASPTLQLNTSGNNQHSLNWDSLSGAQAYRVYRSPDGCSGNWQKLLDTSSLSWTDNSYLDPLLPYAYRVEALGSGGSGAACASAPSACILVKGDIQQVYFPWISR